jgi:hypothetical protein
MEALGTEANYLSAITLFNKVNHQEQTQQMKVLETAFLVSG